MITRVRAIICAANLRSRFRSRDGSSISRALAFADIKGVASNSWSTVQDAYLSTKEVFKNHRVVFTIGTSIASVLTAWVGYSLHQTHQAKLIKGLDQLKKLYGLGWQGAAWYANRKFRREQLKLLGQIKPNRWQILRRPFVRLRKLRTAKLQSSVVPPDLCLKPEGHSSSQKPLGNLI